MPKKVNKYLDEFRFNIKYYREKRQLSQATLSVLCDCGTGTIGSIEAGKAKPSFGMIIKIAEALKISPADLFVRDVSKNKMLIKKELRTLFDEVLLKL